jgi:hypothetical protein
MAGIGKYAFRGGGGSHEDDGKRCIFVEKRIRVLEFNETF